MTHPVLWYTSPASKWTDALPLGNGRLGAMVFGGTTQEELQLNEDTLWSGGPNTPSNPEALANLAAVRALIFEGRFAEAERLADAHLMGRPYLQSSYQPAGRLLFDFPQAMRAQNYDRRLDLASAIASTRYEVDGVAYHRECFVSAADGVLAMRIWADRPGALSFGMEFVSEQPGHGEAASGSLRYHGRNRGENGIAGQLSWFLEARLVNVGGVVTSEGDRIGVDGADAVTIHLDIATSYRRFDDVSGDPEALVAARLDAAGRKGFDALRADHIAAHKALFDRFDIELGPSPAVDLPTGTRIAQFAETDDPEFAALYVQYGRYLTICSSRPGTQPANLQGIWNKEIRPPWGSKLTTNINAEMNYWLADAANLAPCVEPLIQLVEELAVSGADTARVNYGARGWVLHHNTDVWRATAPVDGAQWGVWPTGGAWLCAQLWDHARYAGFPRELVARLYPLLKGAAQFFIDTLVQLPGTDRMVTCPSISPENVHPHGSTICAGPTMDNQILRDLFAAVADAATRLGRDADFAAEVTAMRGRLPADRIGKSGQLQEWLEDWDLDVPEIHHRHVSHLYGVYPSLQIDPRRDPELAAAARRSLEIRGDDATGWGIGWRINLWARLGDGNHAFDVVRRLIHPERSYDNLFDAHPPFQIDGNFGGAAGILEMLVQSDEASVFLLPALPDAWGAGRVRGLRARGGIALDFSWRDRRLQTLVASCDQPYAGTIWHGSKRLAGALTAGRHELAVNV